jgi:hypothetical protein
LAAGKELNGLLPALLGLLLSEKSGIGLAAEETAKGADKTEPDGKSTVPKN